MGQAEAGGQRLSDGERQLLGAHPGAVIGPRAEIGTGTMINAGAAIGPNVRIGRHCAIGANVSITNSLIGGSDVIPVSRPLSQ